MMNIVEMYEQCKAIYQANEDKHYYFGLRFEDKDRQIGEECEFSRHNPDREDEREFPAFGTEEYEEMEILDGTSAWDMSRDETYEISAYANRENDCRNHFPTEHCYIIAGKKLGRHDDPDPGEILIKDAIVIAKIF